MGKSFFIFAVVATLLLADLMLESEGKAILPLQNVIKITKVKTQISPTIKNGITKIDKVLIL